MFLMFFSSNWPNFIVSLSYFSRDRTIYLLQLFVSQVLVSYFDKAWNILRIEIAFKVKWKAFFFFASFFICQKLFHTLKFAHNYTLWNNYIGADLMFWFKKGLFLIIGRLYLSSNTNFFFPLVSTDKHSKHGEWLQSIKQSLTALTKGLDEIPIYSPILTLRCLTHSQ